MTLRKSDHDQARFQGIGPTELTWRREEACGALLQGAQARDTATDHREGRPPIQAGRDRRLDIAILTAARDSPTARSTPTSPRLPPLCQIGDTLAVSAGNGDAPPHRRSGPRCEHSPVSPCARTRTTPPCPGHATSRFVVIIPRREPIDPRGVRGPWLSAGHPIELAHLLVEGPGGEDATQHLETWGP